MTKSEETLGQTASAPAAGDARIGAVVDKYTIIRMLGKGGMGAVYEAHHARLSRRFAIKFLLPELAVNPEVLRRFENEAKAAGGLEHPNVAAVTDFGRAPDGAPYLVMEFLEGEDCAKLLRRLGPLPVPRAANIVVQACRGLAVAHRAGIVHRDLKPENLFLADAGDGSDLVKVLDFGIAKLQNADASVATGTGATFGTAYYMSPEQARGAGEVDHGADVWSLGVVLYELLSGRRPFTGEQFLHVIHQILSVEPPSLATLRTGIPPRLLAVVERAMAKNVGERFPSVTAFAEALGPFAGKGVLTPAEGMPMAMMETIATSPTQMSGPAVSKPRITEPPTTLPVVPPAARSSAKLLLGIGLVIVLGVATALLVLRRAADPVARSGVAGDRPAPTSELRPGGSGHPRPSTVAPSAAPIAAPVPPPPAPSTPSTPSTPSSQPSTPPEATASERSRHAEPSTAASPRRVRKPLSVAPTPNWAPDPPKVPAAPPKPSGGAVKIDSDNPY